MGMTTQTHGHYSPQWTLGDRLRRIRRDAGLTQGKFAELLQVGEKRYAAWEADTNVPGGAQLMAVARRVAIAYGRDASDFVLGMEPVATPDPDPTPPAGETDMEALRKLADAKRSRTRGRHTHRYFPPSVAAA